MRGRLLVLGLLAGCAKDPLPAAQDAGIDTPGLVDAPGSSRCVAPTTDAQPAAMHTLFVNFDGVTLIPCGGGDARINCSLLVQQDTVFPPFMDGDAARDATISSILYNARKGLAPYSLDIVTTRPASGNYDMIVVGGTPALLGLIGDYGGIAPYQCTPDNRNNVSIMFDRGLMPTPRDYAYSILSDVGVLAGLAGTTADNDCLCRGAGGCKVSNANLCTYGVDVPTSPDPSFNCGRTTQDEPALMQAAYGCR